MTLSNWNQCSILFPVPSPYGPELIEVITQNGGPKAVRFRSRLLQVKDVLDLWRTDDEWWRKPISRLYYSLEFGSGSRFTVFQDLITGQWHRQNWVS